MACHITQTNPGSSQNLLRRAFNSQVSLSYTMLTWINFSSLPGAGHQIWGINNNIWGNSGNGYFLETGATSGGQFKLTIAQRRTWFGPDFQTATTSATFPLNTWLPVALRMEGTAQTCSLMELIVNKVSVVSMVPSVPGRPQDTFPYIHIGGYWGTGVGSTGDTALSNVCIAYNALYSVSIDDDALDLFMDGTIPKDLVSGIIPDLQNERIYDLQLLDVDTAELSEVAPDFEIVGEDGFANCDDEPPVIVNPEPDATGGSGMQMEPMGCILRAQPYSLLANGYGRDLNSVLELGPFRFVEQKESDETSMVTTLILGLTEVDVGLVVEIDMALLDDETIDMATLVDVLGDDIEIDMGEGVDSSDAFTCELLGNEDGSTYPGAPIEFKPEQLDVILDQGSTKQYAPTGYSYIYHRVRLKATEIDEKFAVKFVDLSGTLTGRLL
jgi:hypothetical protein